MKALKICIVLFLILSVISTAITVALFFLRENENGEMISYQLMNTGDQIHFLFNQMERRNNLLNDYGVTPSGGMTRNPTLKNLDKGYEFLPKFGKQVSAKQMIIPCLYRNYICFAKIDYN